MELIWKNINGYQVHDFINKWTFGSVFRAEKDWIQYALKVFHEDFVLREFMMHGEENRIKREIDIMKSLSHPNIVSYVDSFVVFEESWNSYILVMEYIAGKNLRQLLREAPWMRFSEEMSLDIYKQILKGLLYLHNQENEIIHRDLKPENILVTNTGEVKIVDFWISKVIDFTSLTSTWDQIGTWLYMSPEQITDSKHIDRRSDLYASGVILYEMLTWMHPYDYQFLPELVNKIQNENEYPERPNSRWVTVSNNLENTILKLLEKKPFKRFHSAEEIEYQLSLTWLHRVRKLSDLSPRFIWRLNNERETFKRYYERNPSLGFVEFPAHFASVRNYQWLFADISTSSVKVIIDPSTNQLAYDSYLSKISLKGLPYSPFTLLWGKLETISPELLKDVNLLKQYVSTSLTYQSSLNGDILFSPFHHLSNSTTVSASSSRNALFDWLDLEYKLIKESIEFRNQHLAGKELYVGISFQEDVLRNEAVTKQILNKFSLLEVDWFFVYVDKVSVQSSASLLVKYAKFLQDLQSSTWKPVIAWRVWILWLLLIALGITGFTSWPAERDTFYEEIIKKSEEAYGWMPVKYYFRQLLGYINIPNRKDSSGVVPAPIAYEAVTQYFGRCDCYFCSSLNWLEVIEAANVKLHFMEMIYEEVEQLKNLAIPDRKPYFLSRIEEAIDHYEHLRPLVGLKSSDFWYLYEWKEVLKSI